MRRRFLQRKPAPGNVRALFLHIQKTAGTAVVDAVRPYYADSITTHGDCWGSEPCDLARIKFVSGHIGYDFAHQLMRDRYTFTFLREPRDRILSMYYFCRSRDPAAFIIYQRAHELSLDEFLRAGFTDPWVRKNVWNNQVWQLAHGYAHLDKRTISDFGEAQLLDLAQRHLGELSYVGFTDTFSEDTAAVLGALALPTSLGLRRVNALDQRPRCENLSRETMALLDQLTVLDRQLYTYAKALRLKSVGDNR